MKVIPNTQKVGLILFFEDGDVERIPILGWQVDDSFGGAPTLNPLTADAFPIEAFGIERGSHAVAYEEEGGIYRFSDRTYDDILKAQAHAKELIAA